MVIICGHRQDHRGGSTDGDPKLPKLGKKTCCNKHFEATYIVTPCYNTSFVVNLSDVNFSELFINFHSVVHVVLNEYSVTKL